MPSRSNDGLNVPKPPVFAKTNSPRFFRFLPSVILFRGSFRPELGENSPTWVRRSSNARTVVRLVAASVRLPRRCPEARSWVEMLAFPPKTAHQARSARPLRPGRENPRRRYIRPVRKGRGRAESIDESAGWRPEMARGSAWRPPATSPRAAARTTAGRETATSRFPRSPPGHAASG